MLQTLLSGEVLIVVPKPNVNSMHGITAGSGIVARIACEGMLDVYYEGNLYGASNIKTFEDRAYHAWDRMCMKYPTTARMRLPVEDVVAHYDVVGQVVGNTMQVNEEVRALIDRWCGKPAGAPRYTLDKFATGRYDVRLPSGMRAGSIIGGAGTWCAEIGNKSLGYRATKALAAELILDEMDKDLR